MSRAWDIANRVFWDLHSATWDSWVTQSDARDRAQAVVEWLRSVDVPSGAAVLDAGCATGEITVALARAGFRVTGLDLSPAMLWRARRKVTSCGLVATLRIGSLNEKLPFSDGSFDAGVCSHAIQCVPDPPRLWREFLRVLVPRGVLLIEAKLPGSPPASPAASGHVARLPRLLKRWASQAAIHWGPEDVSGQLARCGYADVQCTVSAATVRVAARCPTTRCS